MLFSKKHAPGRPEALEGFRRNLTKAIDAARFGGVNCAALADIFEEHAAGLRRTYAVSIGVVHHVIGE